MATLTNLLQLPQEPLPEYTVGPICVATELHEGVCSSEKMKQVASTFTEESNPVLIEVTLK